MRREIDVIHVRVVLVAIILADFQTHAVESCHSHNGVDDKKSQPSQSLFVGGFVIILTQTQLSPERQVLPVG